MKILLMFLLIPLLLTPAFANVTEEYEQILPSEQGTLNIGLSVVTEPEPNSLS